MSLRLVHPLPLLTLVPLALVALGVRVRFGPMSPRGRLWAALHWGALVLLVVALGQPQLRTGARPPTVLVIDRSASIDANMQATEDAWVRSVARTSCPRPCRVVQFAAEPQPLPALNGALAAHAPTGAAVGATNLQAALNTALGLVPRGGRVVVLSDGWQTTGDALAAAARARAADVQLDYVRLSDPTLRYAAITQIHAPATAHTGDPLPLQLTVRSSVTEPATLFLQRDGVTIGSQTVDLRAGDNPMLLSYTAPAPGWHSFRARIVLFSDDMPQNDALAATVDVVGAPRVLAVTPAGGTGGAALATLLRRLGFRVTAIAPAGLPGSAGALASTDGVVLDDVPASALHPAQVDALSSAVRNGGLGLLALGGPRSFSLGGYAHTPLEQLLPVTSLVPGNVQRRNVAIELVLDHSGSMIDLAGGVPKIQMARAAGTQVAQFVAAHQDDLGIVDFDVAPHVLVPIQRVASRALERSILTKVDGLQANGGTNIYAGLQSGVDQLERSAAPEKHLILMTDGISQPENYAPLLGALARDHIAVATVALGAGADQGLLHSIAAATGGNFYFTDNAHDLPRIFAKETRFAVSPVRLAGHVTVTPGSDSPVVRSLAGKRLPDLAGNVITSLRATAQADLLATAPGSKVSPALAQWQDGAGRVVVFTPGLGAPWAAAWSGQSGLWDDAVRWVERGVSAAPLTPVAVAGSPPSLEIDLAQSGAAALRVSKIAGTLLSSTGGVYPVEFARIGPSVYDAALPSVPEGVYGFGLDARGVRGLAASGLVAIPYSLEYEPRLPTDTPLGPVAELTGGRELAEGDPGLLGSGGSHALWWALALAALVLFLAGALGRQLDRAPPDRAGRDYTRTRPAVRADSDSRSSTETSVGART
jgi:uncharacterized membrane protein